MANILLNTPFIGDASIADRQIKTYIALERLNIDDSTLSDTDFNGNISTIITAMPNNSTFRDRPAASTMLVKSFLAKLNTDSGISYGALPVGIEISKFGGDVSPVLITAIVDATNNYNRVYQCVFDKLSSGEVRCSKFAESYNENGFNSGGETSTQPSGNYAIPTYDSISSLGLNYNADGNEDDFSSTDATANFLKVFQALPTKAYLVFTVASSSNFAKAIKAKITSDLNLTYASYYDIICERLGVNNMTIRIMCQNLTMSTLSPITCTFSRNENNGSLGAFALNNSISANTTSITAGTSSLPSRAIYLQYE